MSINFWLSLIFKHLTLELKFSYRLITNAYTESTFTGVLQNYNSFVPFTYKKDFNLPFIGKFSKFPKNKSQKLTRQFYNEDTNIKIVFSTFKFASLFSTKVKVSYGLKSYVIYKFLCVCCKASYVGETCRHRNISIRTYKHLETDKSSKVYPHVLKNPQCKSIHF